MYYPADALTLELHSNSKQHGRMNLYRPWPVKLEARRASGLWPVNFLSANRACVPCSNEREKPREAAGSAAAALES
eukprot:364308-Chlamydomonas_euryale.AAC.5